MARDYPWFKHDVDMWSDEKVERLTAVHGLLSYGLYCYILERIYRDPSMRYRLASDSAWRALACKVDVPLDHVRAMVCAMVDEGLFDRTEFDVDGTLYSHGADRRREERDRKRDADRERIAKKRDAERVAATTGDTVRESRDVEARNDDVAYRDKKEEGRKKKQEHMPTPAAPAVSALDEMCDRIYQAYPRKLDPRKARESIRRAIHPPRGSRIEPIAADELLRIVEQFADHCRRSGREKKHIPHPTTFFNGERYRNDLCETFPELYPQAGTTVAVHQGPFRTFAR